MSSEVGAVVSAKAADADHMDVQPLPASESKVEVEAVVKQAQQGERCLRERWREEL